MLTKRGFRLLLWTALGACVLAPAGHSQRIFAALQGPNRLILVPGARHNESLGGSVWADIDRWIDDAMPAAR